MIGQLTQDGIDALNGNTHVVLTEAQLGSGYNYIPDVSDTGLHGSLVFTTEPSAPLAQSANRVRYSVYLDHNIGPFQFGELALRMANGKLFALFAGSELIEKLPLSGIVQSNSIKLEIFVDLTGDNYAIWLDLAETNNNLQVPRINSPDQLPPPKDATPNIYVIGGASASQQATLAVTDRQGLWALYGYDFADDYSGTIIGADSLSIVISETSFSEDFIPAYFGELVLQFTSGNIYGICRYVKEAIQQPSGDWRLVFNTPMAILPENDDTFQIHTRSAILNTSVQLPIATTSDLGAVIIGSGLNVDASGVVSVVFPAPPTITVDNIPPDENGNIALGLAEVARTGSYSSLINVPSQFNPFLASATVRGGVKVVPGSGLYVDENEVLRFDGTPVTSVNGQPGPEVTIIGLIDPAAILSGANLNTYLLPGLYYAASDAIGASLVNGQSSVPMKRGTLEVVPLSNGKVAGLVMQRWTQDDYTTIRIGNADGFGPWLAPSNPPIATTSTLGVVQIGAGLNITVGGILSSKIQSVNGKSDAHVILNANDVGAIPLNQVGVAGGVAGPLTNPDGGTYTIEEERYLFARNRLDQLPRDAVYYAGEWDASTNSAVHLDPEGNMYEYTLLNNGEFERDDSGTIITVPASGALFKVTVAGSTNIDGTSSWGLDDLILAAGDKWVKVGAGGGAAPIPTTMTDVTIPAETTVPITVPAWVTDPLSVQVVLRVQDVDNNANWYDASGVATVIYTSSGISIKNEYTIPLNFKYRVA